MSIHIRTADLRPIINLLVNCISRLAAYPIPPKLPSTQWLNSPPLPALYDMCRSPRLTSSRAYINVP